MNQQFLNEVFERYVQHFPVANGTTYYEVFKWEAVECFQRNWDIESKDFPNMFKEATKKVSVLLEGMSTHPVSSIKMLLKKEDEVEFVRERFRELFAEDGGNLDQRQQRMESFIEQINHHIAKYVATPGLYAQSARSVLGYLSLWRPEENYFYKYSHAANWAAYSEYGFDFGFGSHFSLPKYYKMCDELLAAVQQHAPIIEIHPTRFHSWTPSFDDKYHILIYDIIYCATTYHYYLGMPKPVKAKGKLKKVSEQEEKKAIMMELEDLKEQEALLAAKAELPNMLGQSVLHKDNGSGTVEKILQVNGYSYITAVFSNKTYTSVFPDAFTKGHLKACDEAIQEKFVLYPTISAELKLLQTKIKLLEQKVKSYK